MGSTVAICLILAVVMIRAAVSYHRKLSEGCCGSGGDREEPVRPADGEKSRYPYVREVSVEGMMCKNCAVRVANAFNRREGCLAEVDFGKKRLTLYTKAPMEDGELRSIVAGAGYTAGEIREKN